MNEVSAPTITVQVLEGVSKWPERSQPPSGSSLTEGCWRVGLSTARFTLDRRLFPSRWIAVSRGKDPPEQRLLRKLLEIEQVETVLAANDTLIVSGRAQVQARWAEVAARMERVIRENLVSREDEIREKIELVLDREINPGVAMHGGHIRVLDVRGTTVFIEMGGGCQGCGMASVTLKQGVERSIRAAVPEVTEILDTTDHATGKNPFYKPQEK